MFGGGIAIVNVFKSKVILMNKLHEKFITDSCITLTIFKLICLSKLKQQRKFRFISYLLKEDSNTFIVSFTEAMKKA